jgi:hypothetical protein
MAGYLHSAHLPVTTLPRGPPVKPQRPRLLRLTRGPYRSAHPLPPQATRALSFSRARVVVRWDLLVSSTIFFNHPSKTRTVSWGRRDWTLPFRAAGRYKFPSTPNPQPWVWDSILAAITTWAQLAWSRTEIRRRHWFVLHPLRAGDCWHRRTMLRPPRPFPLPKSHDCTRTWVPAWRGEASATVNFPRRCPAQAQFVAVISSSVVRRGQIPRCVESRWVFPYLVQYISLCVYAVMIEDGALGSVVVLAGGWSDTAALFAVVRRGGGRWCLCRWSVHERPWLDQGYPYAWTIDLQSYGYDSISVILDPSRRYRIQWLFWIPVQIYNPLIWAVWFRSNGLGSPIPLRLT